MITARKTAALAFLVIAITGCAPKKNAATPPPQAQAPSINTGQAAMYPPPLTQPPPQPPAQTATPATAPAPQQTPPPQTAQKPKRTTHRAKPSPAKPASGDQGTATQTASNGDAPPASPIGQLSNGDVAAGAQTRRETVDMINNTESGLNGIKRNLSSSEQETATQIRTFLTKARQALGVDDVDGAHTLAIKAKVLLDELIKG